MARIWITDDVFKVSRVGFDPRTAVLDQLLISSDYITDQAVVLGAAAFGGGNTVTVALPPGQANYKVDFFYCVLSGGQVQQTLFPDTRFPQLRPGGLYQQLVAEISGGNVIFTRVGNIAGQANRGVQYVIYSSPLG